MTTEEHCEVERKYDVDPDAGLPDLGTVPGVDRVAEPVDVEQTATYFDTPDLRLLSERITLRRRTGGLDDGWHLKLPLDGDRRAEVRVPLGEAHDGPPSQLLDRVRVFVRDRPVRPSAVLVTRRTVLRLLDGDSTVLAEVCDDRVTATRPGTAYAAEDWREWEVEVVGGPAQLLDAVEPLLRSAGARQSAVASKAARVLDRDLPPPPAQRVDRTVGPKVTTGELLTAYVAEHLARLERQDQLLRTGDQEGVHQLRVAARRIRSALTTYTPVLEPDAVTALRAELKWFGGVLAEARDAQVLRERLRAMVEAQPPDLVLGPVADRIGSGLEERFRAGRVHADLALDGPRYFRLLDDLESFLDDPPVTDVASRRARKSVADLVQAELDRLHKRDRAYRRAATQHDRDLALHEVRKSAKRLRYASESVQPVFGKPAATLAGRAEALQELLGEHQDSVVSRAALRALGERAHEAGECAFTYGRLHALEEARAGELERRYRSLVEDLPRRKLRAWLRR